MPARPHCPGVIHANGTFHVLCGRAGAKKCHGLCRRHFEAVQSGNAALVRTSLNDCPSVDSVKASRRDADRSVKVWR